MSITLRTGPALRPGQEEALRRWAAALNAGSRSELVVVPVGYGKTVIGVGSFDVAANITGADTCLYLTPTDVLRTQVHNGVDKALSLLGSTRSIRKALAENATADRLESTGANFIVASYQQLVASPVIYQRLAKKRRLHLVCDEAHHLCERGRWAEALNSLAPVSTMMLSATPVRLDREGIAGARYTEGEEGPTIDPLLSVSMRQAWKEGRVLKHLNMQMKDYAVQLQSREGEIVEFTASEMAELPNFDQAAVRRQLRWNEDYVQPLVREFALTLLAKMASAKGEHQGLVFAATTEHANHLARLFGRWHPSLRCAVVHSGVEVSEAENEKRLKAFHAGKHDVLVQVRKASEGFDAPTVSTLLKLDAVFSREPVIQQLGRGLRFNHRLPEAQNMLNVFIGRDARLASIIEHLERELPPPAIERGQGTPSADGEAAGKDKSDESEGDGPEILDVAEAGDAYLDHTGRFVEGQQLTMFGVKAPIVPAAIAPEVQVVDISAELKEAIDYCKSWTNRAARERGKQRGPGENHFASMNRSYSRETNNKGTLSTPAQYRAKGDWMKRKYEAMLR